MSRQADGSGSARGGRPAREALSRRRLLGLGAALPLLAACTPVAPTVDGPARTPSAGPSATRPGATAAPPTPAPGAAAAATTELTLAGLARSLAAGRAAGLTADQRRRLGFLADAHRAHAAALDPAARTPAPPPAPGRDARASLARLARAEVAAAGRHRTAALAAGGDDALLLAAVAAADGLYGRALPAPGPVPLSGGPRTPPRLARGTDVEAVQALVAQLHAVVYGYQLATGRMPVAGKRDDQALAELLQLRLERDRLIGWLRRRGAEVPVPEPAYEPTVEVRDGPTGVRLVRTMLVALQPHAGVWLAAAADAERERALAFFVRTVDLARGWGAPLPVWPAGTG